MSKKEISLIFQKIKENNDKIPNYGRRRMLEFFARFVSQEEYDYVKEDVIKLKEKYSNIESEIKEKTNEISFKEFVDLINELKNISTIEETFVITKEKKKNIEYEDLIKLYFKLKHIILLKGVSACYTLYFQDVLYFIIIFNFHNEYLKESIIETEELTTFIFSNIFRIGEVEKYDNLEQKLKKKYDFDYRLSMQNAFTKIKEPMRKPITSLEKIISYIMKIQNMENKSKISYDIFNNINNSFEENIDSFNDFEKDFFKIVIIPVIKELNKEVIIDKTLNDDLLSSNLEINIKNRLFFYLEENLGKDEDLYNEYKNFHHLDKLNKKDSSYPILQKTICSFLNTKGGRIYIGITDDFDVKGYYIGNKNIKNKIKNNLLNVVSEFYPKVENDKIKIHFIPLKNYPEEDYIENKYVIKIIISQGNIHKLYSTCKDSFHSFIRLPGLVRELKCEDIKEEIIRRMSSKEEPVDPKQFDDVDPEPLNGQDII